MAGRKGRSGRKPLPISVLKMRGTYRADRHASRTEPPEPTTDVFSTLAPLSAEQPPDFLDERQTEIWRETVNSAPHLRAIDSALTSAYVVSVDHMNTALSSRVDDPKTAKLYDKIAAQAMRHVFDLRRALMLGRHGPAHR